MSIAALSAAEREALFHRMWSCNGIRTSEIARHFGVTSSAIHQRAKTRGWPPRIRDDAKIRDREAFRRMWLAGVVVVDMAAHFGIEIGVVQNCARIMGLPRRKREQGATRAGWPSISLREFAEEELARKLKTERAAA